MAQGAMRVEDKKYVWWGLLGVGVAALFYFLSVKQKQNGVTGTAVTVPYLVPQTTNGASPAADTSLSTQSNIVGSHPNSNLPNYTNMFMTPANPAEYPGMWNYIPQANPVGQSNNLNYANVQQPQGAINFQNGINSPGSNYQVPNAN